MATKGVELASAYVSLSANTKDIADSISDVFDGFGVEAEKAGKDAGKKIAKGFDSTKRGARSAGRDSAGAFSNAFTSGIRSTSVAGAISRIGSEAKASGNKAGFIAGKAMGAGITAGFTVGAAGLAVAAAGVGTTLQKGFKRLRTIDAAEAKLKALGHTTGEINEIMGNAEKAVKGTAFSLGDAANIAASAVAAGVEPGKELTEYLTLVADTAAVAGVGIDEMAVIFNKVQTSNKAYTDDLRQLSDRGIPIFQLLQKEYGVTAEELDKMVQNGDVSANDMQRALEGKIGGAAKNMGDSFDGAVANADAAMGRLGAALLSPIFDETKDGVGGITEALDNLTNWVDNNESSIIDFWAGFGKAAIVTAKVVLASVEQTTRTLGWLVNGFGEAASKTLRVAAELTSFIPGADDLTDRLLRSSLAVTGGGDGLLDMADAAADAQAPLDNALDSITEWADGAKTAAEENKKTEDSFGTLGDSITTAADIGADGIDIPVDVDTTQADTKMDGFMAKYSKMIISPQPGAPGGATGMPGTLGATPGVQDTGGSISETNQAIQDYARNELGFTGDIGGYRQPDGYNEHSSGTASDFMVRSPEEGTALLPNLLQRPGVEYILWNQRQWNPDGTSSPMQDRGNPTQNHMDHLHVKSRDTGGWWPDGELAINNTGEPEAVLNPEQQEAVADMGVDLDAVMHGRKQGAAPGPKPAPKTGAARAAELGRTEGFIPEAAANINPVGEGGLSSIFDLGESFVHNAIDTGAQLASMAATSAIAAGSFGAGAAAGPAASTAISLGAEAAKRGVSYGYDLAGIWGEAFVEQLSPFGAPRWLSTPLPTGGFNFPQIPGEQPGEQMMPEGEQPGARAAADLAAEWAQPAQPAPKPGNTTPPPAAPAQPKQPPRSVGGVAGVDWLGLYDQGGILEPNTAAVNLSGKPEAVFTQQQLGDMREAMTAASTSRNGNGEVTNFYSQDLDAMFREYEKQRRREARTYSGRP